MTTGPLRRVKAMTFEEARWRTRELIATLGDRVRFRLHKPAWPRDFDPSVAEHAAARLRGGQSRCVIDPSLAASVREEVLRRWPDAATDAAMRADRIIAGAYDVLGYRGLRFPDWHSDPVHHRRAPLVCWAEVPYLDPSVGDHKVIWELNRHQHWLQLGRAYWLTGDSRYARAVIDQMHSWLEGNPPLTGINWASMLEIGFRTISWTMAVHFLAGYAQLPIGRCLMAIERQLAHLEQHLSYYFSPNTHLTGEALALYVVGQAFPELTNSRRWVDTGRCILLREIDRQILPDGGHVERSMHYQRYSLDFYLLALLTARRTGDVDGARRFASAAAQLAEFTNGIVDHHGRLPLIGDDDGGMLWPIAGRECIDARDSLALAAVVLNRPHLARWGVQEETFWIAAPEALAFVNNTARSSADTSCAGDAAPRVVSDPLSRTFAETGYVVMRSDREHAVFDTGPHGYMNGGHAHADALSLTLAIGERPLLVDPGTSTYTMDAACRDRLRGSFNHNTVSIDGKPQSIPAGPFHWATAAQARLHASRHNPSFDWAEAAHDGYAPIEHRRSVFRAEDAGWFVVDELRVSSQSGRVDSHAVHTAAAHWTFHPGWMVRADTTGRLRTTHLDGREAWLLFDGDELTLVHGDQQRGLGWFAPVYGTLLPTWSARVTRTARLPFSMLSWIDAASAGAAPTLRRIEVTADPQSEAIGAHVTCGDSVSTFLLRPGEPSFRDGRAGSVLHYQTDARALHFRTRGDTLVALDLVDASHALALHDGWLSVVATEPVPDLHIRLNDAVLYVSASEPPRQLRMQGRVLKGFREIRLNGRSHPVPVADGPDSLLITGGDWTSPLVHLGLPFALDEAHPARV